MPGTASVAGAAPHLLPAADAAAHRSAYGDLMRVWQRVRGWAQGHPGPYSMLLALFVLGLTVLARRPPNEPPMVLPSAVGWVLIVLSCAALVARLRRPLEVWSATVGLCLAGAVVDGHFDRSILPVLVATYTVAANRPWRTAVAFAGSAEAVLGVVNVVTSTGPQLPDSSYALAAFLGMACAIGITVSNQRAVVAAAHERTRIAEMTREEEAQRQVAQERLRIARELHDVVAHHISVINVQAGVARHLLMTDGDAAGKALGSVRESAALVLREMVSILGLLRTTEETASTRPAPGAGQIEKLVEDCRRAGLVVTWSVKGTPGTLTPAADLAAYRLVQEALTNALRHGTGEAALSVRWAPDLLLLEVSNPVRAGHRAAASAPPAAGHGLVGWQPGRAKI
jgi:signal transduction histidine kinase